MHRPASKQPELPSWFNLQSFCSLCRCPVIKFVKYTIPFPVLFIFLKCMTTSCPHVEDVFVVSRGQIRDVFRPPCAKMGSMTAVQIILQSGALCSAVLITGRKQCKISPLANLFMAERHKNGHSNICESLGQLGVIFQGRNINVSVSVTLPTSCTTDKNL